ncbi:MAG: phenylalanine--tRNA ligase subunit beta [Candidatus Falkowbacteria bacterium]
MNISLNWLKDFIDIPSKITPEKLGELLTLHTVEIEGVKKLGENLSSQGGPASGWENIVVGKIIELKKHSNADKLKIAIVSDGSKKFNIVCGGSNLFEGMLVAFAKIGAKVHVRPSKQGGERQGDLVELESVEIRGEKSEGMICAASEIGLEGLFPTDDEREVVDLTPPSPPLVRGGMKVGSPLAEALGLDDVVYDVDNKSMTHRPDLWSHFGMARDLAVILDLKLQNYNPNLQIHPNTTNDDIQIKVNVEDTKLCPRYMAVVVDGIEIKPSSDLIQKRLIACGMRPINNIVDITNYVMLEIGQPTHAFGASRIATNSKTNCHEIIVRTAKEGEVIKTLDGEERKLDEEILLITDGKQPVAIAGIMGGGNSEIDKNTKSILIESANFDAVSIRKTSNKLGLRTESSQRYEKSLDPNLCELAVNRILTLIKESCPKAKVASNIVDEKNFKLFDKSIKLDLAWLDQKLGVKIKKDEVVKILKNLGFEITTSPPTPLLSKNRGVNGNILLVKAPTWRATKDIFIPEDLVEEVARIYGYNNIQPVMSQVIMQRPEINEEREFVNKVKNILTTAGLTETYNYSFVNEKQLAKLGVKSDGYLKLANPLTNEHTLLRQSLIPNLIQNIITNQRNFEAIKIFEIGSVFLPQAGELKKDNSSKDKLPDQSMKLGLVCAGSNKDNFSKLKGVVEIVGKSCGVNFNFTEIKSDQGVSSAVLINNKEVGFLNTLSEPRKKQIGVKVNTTICELDIREFFDAFKSANSRKYQAKSKFPDLMRDMAFVIDEKILYNDIRETILSASKLIKEAEVFDVYQGDKIGAGKKNMALHITFGSLEKTLTGAEVDKVQNDIIKLLNKKFKAQLRDY